MKASYPRLLLFLFIGWWLILAISPSYRQDWLLENVIVFLAIPMLILGHRTSPFSNSTYTALFVFFVLHEIGAHYTYSEVPYDRWFQSIFGYSLDQQLGFERNHYDRLIHFLYGLLITPAAIELLKTKVSARGLWGYLLPVSFVMSHSVIYEMVEWLAAEVFGGDLGTAYLGTQGDQWDAQKDMLLATLGCGLSAAIIAWRRRSTMG